MNLEELRDARRTERERDGLQSLPDTFYRDVAAYLADLKAERGRVAEAAEDPFSDPEVRRLTEEIETAEEVVESIYERRVGKVVDRASFAAADMRHETEGLTAEERELFDDLVERIERNRERVLDALDPDASADAAGAPADDDARAGADDAPDPSDLLAEAMGGAQGGGTTPESAEPNEPTTVETDAPDGTETTDCGVSRGTESGDAGAPAAGTHEGNTSPASATEAGDGTTTAPSTPRGNASDPPVDRAGTDHTRDREPGDVAEPDRRTVYVTSEVGEILGVDERTYRLAAEDVVDLPADNARALVERDAAKPLD